MHIMIFLKKQELDTVFQILKFDFLMVTDITFAQIIHWLNRNIIYIFEKEFIIYIFEKELIEIFFIIMFLFWNIKM